jgi:integrase
VAGKQVDDLVSTGIGGGGPLRARIFRDGFDTAAKTIGLAGLHPHRLRHTAASLSIGSGADAKLVQQMLGHSNAAMTMDVYGHTAASLAIASLDGADDRKPLLHPGSAVRWT